MWRFRLSSRFCLLSRQRGRHPIKLSYLLLVGCRNEYAIRAKRQDYNTHLDQTRLHPSPCTYSLPCYNPTTGNRHKLQRKTCERRMKEMSDKVTFEEASRLVEWTVRGYKVIGQFPESQKELSGYHIGIDCFSSEHIEGITSPRYEAYFQELPIDERSGVQIAFSSEESLEDAKTGVIRRLVETINGTEANTNRWMSHEDIRKDYIHKAEERNPGKGQDIGEFYLFLQGKLLFMKYRFSEYKKMMSGDKVDRIVLNYYLQRFFQDASDAFLDGVILGIVNFVDKRGDAERGHLSLYSFLSYVNDEELKKKLSELEVKANSIIRRRHGFVAHWGKVAIIEGQTIPISIDEVDCVIELIVEIMEYIGEQLLGLNHFSAKSGSYDPWELIAPGGVEHVIVDLKRYEWLTHRQKEYLSNGEPFLSPPWFDIFDLTEPAEEERRKQRERILALVDT